MKLSRLKDKKILILGFGKEGRNTFAFLRKLFPNKLLGIADKAKLSVKTDKRVKKFFGNDYLNAIKKFDLIIKSPGIPIHLKEVEDAFNKKKVTSQTELFLDNCPGQVIGITGTKGKSTTTSLIYQILKRAGIKVKILGNIGKPMLSSLIKARKDQVFVCELSSHQLYGLKKSPHISVLLNIYPEHLDYYCDFNEYINAKANITRYQLAKDYLVFNADNEIVKKIAKRSGAKKIRIRGEYHDLNKQAAKAVAGIFQVPNNIIDQVIKHFKPLAHRLELVGTFQGITFYNDALATIPEATIGAIKTLGSRVETIILGGFERNIDFKELAEQVLKSGIKTVILFPTTGERIWQELKKKTGKLPQPFFVDNMKDAVRIAYQNTKKGKVCLLSTASSSFSIFKDYKEKGDLFKKYVKQFGHGFKH